jgi:predicted nucleic acid-binding protein
LGFDSINTDPFGGFVTNPLVSDVQDERLVEKLEKQLGLPKPDAQHLAQAISNNADVFLTRDEEHFISQRATIEAQLKIKIRLPSEVLAEI